MVTEKCKDAFRGIFLLKEGFMLGEFVMVEENFNEGDAEFFLAF